MADVNHTDDGRTDGGSDILDDVPAYTERVEKHREALTEIAASGAPDAHVARILLARAEDREPDPEDLARLIRADFRQGEARVGEGGLDMFCSPSERFERAAERVFEQVTDGNRGVDRGGE